MKNKINIIRKNIQVPIIDKDGNFVYDKSEYRYVLVDENNKIISNYYHCIMELENDHFSVCNVNEYVKYFSNDDYYDWYDIINGDYRILNPKLKWGVIRINRNDKGEVLACDETLVVPYLYDEIKKNKLKTVTVSNKGKFSYLDLDVESEYYGQQLVPCVLGHAWLFSEKYDGFAECSINGNIGYLPRNCYPKEFITCHELLSNRQVEFLSKYFNSSGCFVLSSETIDDYFRLTGEKLSREKKLLIREKL